MEQLRADLGTGPQLWALDDMPLTIGRSTENRVVISDRFVSARHAVINRTAGGVQLEDLGSSNGTRVNGQQIDRVLLRDGDVIQIGKTSLHYTVPPPAKIPLPAAAPASAPDLSVTSEAAMLDELVSSIRTHRARDSEEREHEQARLREEWLQVLALAGELKQKVAVDPRVRHFGIDDKAMDIVIRIQREPQAVQQIISISLRHPDHRDHPDQGLWLLRTGQPDNCMPNAQRVATELVRELAFLLA